MRKIYISYIATISILSLVYINNTSALDYSSNVGIGFTFNPTLSISLSSNDLVISNLVPGSMEDSNSINVSVATNASYGYMLSANVGDDIHNNSNLTHSNNTNIFSSVATDADLAILTTDNTWGYSTSLDNGSSWSNYNGLSSSTSTTLIDNSNTADSTSNIDFKIGAKASSTQASGTYTNTINFIAVTKVAPMSLLDSFIASGAEQLNGYYKMQDMTHDICNNVDIEESELQLIDIRDNKVYWVAKLKDGNCWMTQNLDLDLDSNRTYTHWDTDLGWSTEDGSTVDENATWRPTHSTIDFDGANTNQVPGWINSNTEPYSANPGDIYYYTSNSDADDIKYNSLQECITAGHNDCAHYHTGNYYNWSVVVGSNDTSGITSGSAPDSVCAKGWRLPNNNSAHFQYLANLYEIAINTSLKLRNQPLWFTRSGYVKNTSSSFRSSYGFYWSSTAKNGTNSYHLYFYRSSYNASFFYYDRYYGFSTRCIAR